MSSYWFGSHKNAALLSLLSELASRDRATTAELLAVIGEVEVRRLHRRAGYGSMYRYCLGVLHMSEDVAFKRIQVARAARKFPAILERIADGRLHLSGAILLVPRLEPENADALLAAATHKTKREILLLLAQHFPQADVATVIEPIPARGASAFAVASVAAAAQSTPACTVAAAPSASVPADSTGQLDPDPVAASGPSPQLVRRESVPPYPRVEPLAPGRYAVQFTADQECHDLLRYAQALFGHAVPDGATLEVLKRALRAVIAQEERRKFGVGTRMCTVKDPKDPRYVSPKDRCEVFVRDEGACTFEGEGGRRCGSQTRLQFHHKQPFAQGGASTADNLTLHCAAHDQLQAERDYGEGFMREKREAARARTEARTAARPPQPDGDSDTAAAARSARARGLSPADVLGSRAAAAETQARLDAMLAESA